jgi:hypothetical protein
MRTEGTIVAAILMAAVALSAGEGISAERDRIAVSAAYQRLHRVSACVSVSRAPSRAGAMRCRAIYEEGDVHAR